MAHKSCFSTQIVRSGAFLEMPLSAQALYFHLGMEADNEGFVNNPRIVTRMISAADDDLRLLVAKNFVIVFESGVIVIKGWRINNTLRSDRFKETAYAAEKSMLYLKPNGSYTLDSTQGKPLLTCAFDSGIPAVYQMATSGSPKLKETKLKETKSNEGNKARTAFVPPSLDEVQAYVKEKGYHFDAEAFIAHYEANGWVQANGRAKIKNWKMCCTTWEKNVARFGGTSDGERARLESKYEGRLNAKIG